VERVEEVADSFQKTRLQILQEAAQKPCVCGQKWRAAAKELFEVNSIDPSAWKAAMLDSLIRGRRKGNLVVHAGLKGNEGKSFLLGPLVEVYGQSGVFPSPSSANFPLLGLEGARVALLDDWRFNEKFLSYNIQLLWFEGKPVVIARPQNQYTGHLRYSKDAPIFISTLEADLRTIPEGLKAGDVEMMLKRLHIFRFFVPLVRPVEIASCGKCFAELLLSHMDQHRNNKQPASAEGAAASTAAQEPVLPTADAQSPRAANSGTKRGATGPTGETPNAKKWHSWSVEDVCSYLVKLELAHVSDKFRACGVDGAFLADLSEEDMVQELGLLKLQARKVKSRLPA